MPQYLECLATVPCDLSLITIPILNCHLFSDINISQGSGGGGGIFSYYFTANLLLNQPVKEFFFENWLRFDRVTTQFDGLLFLEHSVLLLSNSHFSR